MKETRRKKGYVLVVTLILLALAAAGLSQLCYFSLDSALKAGAAQDELQRRWGQITCTAALLPRCEQILSRSHRAGEPLPGTSLRFTLGKQEVFLIVSDEQAKVNVNTLADRLGIESTKQKIRGLLSDHDANGHVKFQPTAANGQGFHFDAYESIFSGVDAQYFSGILRETAPTSDLTCWGNGQLNIERAAKLSLEAVCAPDLEGALINRLIELRQQRGGAPDVEDILNKLPLTPQQHQNVAGRLTNRSACHSLWFIVRVPQRSWYSYSVMRNAPEGSIGGERRWTFNW